MPYAIYLRKSRVDLEAEAHGEGDTLARHRKTLLALAAAQQLNVTHIYEEVVSGDTIAARPQMQQLLADVDEGLWEGVLVMEVERLARGDTIDQGIVAQAFKVTDTKIITPLKSYDPNNEFDEEYFEFGLFMARREYKVINRRLQRGRLASVKEGKWVGNTPPYGYRRVKLAQDKGFWLEPDPETAPASRPRPVRLGQPLPCGTCCKTRSTAASSAGAGGSSRKPTTKPPAPGKLPAAVPPSGNTRSIRGSMNRW